MPAERELSSRPSLSASTTPIITTEEENLEDLRIEKESYAALVHAGGCPPYPVHLLEDFFWNTEMYLENVQYRDLILFWQEMSVRPPERRYPFRDGLLYRWNSFRWVQCTIRRGSISSEAAMMDVSRYERASPERSARHPVFPKYIDGEEARLVGQSKSMLIT